MSRPGVHSDDRWEAFTLLEVMLWMVILGVMSLTFFRFADNSVRATWMISRKTDARLPSLGSSPAPLANP